MKDETGRVKITGWYDNVDPLGDAERRAIAEAPEYDNTLRSQLGLARSEGSGKSLLELINEPSLNINGISSGDVGALARNVIPTTASRPFSIYAWSKASITAGKFSDLSITFRSRDFM